MLRNPGSLLSWIAMIALLGFGACQATEPILQATIEDILAEEGLVGVAWTMVEGAGEVSFGSAGQRDSQLSTGFAADTQFHVGSLTKTLLATGVLRLVTEGRIDLDAPALRYLPDLRFDNPWADFSVVTVRHLLDHTSGLSDAQMWHMFSLRADPNSPLRSAFPDPGRQLRIRSQPGARFSYSNIGYTLLGMIIESVVGVRYETYLDQYLLAPLSMRNSTFAYTTQSGAGAEPKLAWGHVDGGRHYGAMPIFLRPAGQFTTTTPDLARFAEFLLGSGHIAGEKNGQPFLDSALMLARGIPLGTEAANGGLAAGYALGIGRRDRHGVVGYCHGGNIVGFVAMLCLFPDQHKAFAYSVNTDSETANYGRLEKAFKQALKIPQAVAPPTVQRAPATSDWLGTYVLSPNRFQMFEYLDTVFGAINIDTDGNFLVMTSIQQDARHLRPVGEQRYSSQGRATASHQLIKGSDGQYLISDGFKTYQKTSTIYLIAHWTSLILGLTGLVFVLLAGGFLFLRQRSKFFRQPLAPAFVGSACLFAPIPFFFNQSFMALGDFTLASALLAAVTVTLPVGMLATLYLSRNQWRQSRAILIQTIAAVCVLQWCIVLAAAGMLPFRLWI